MDERDNVFNPAEPDNTEPVPQAQPTEQELESIAEKYSSQEPVEVEAEKIEEPVQPAYNAYSQPQQPQYNFDPNTGAPANGYNPNTGAPTYTYNPNTGATQQYGWQPSYPQPPQDDGKKKKKKGRKVFCILLAIVVIISAVAIPVSLNKGNNPQGNGGLQNNQEAPTVIDENAPQLEIGNTPQNNTVSDGKILTATEIYEKVAEINVAVMVYANDSLYTEGTGIVMGEDDKGKYTYILTCAHVISDAGIDVAVQLEDGKRYDADIVGYDARTDIGVLKIEAKGLKAAEFGDSDSLKVGSTVYAIGNPGGSALFGTFTDGRVSAIGRNITSSIGYDMVCIQHNAAISPGNSGGALINEYGQVIGINSAKIAATEYEGIAFSIPITQAQDIINKVIAYGYVPGRAKLGISYVANDNSSISSIYSMAVQMKGLPSGSLVIYSIDENSALTGTDAQPGDMIISVNGKDLDKADVLLETIEDSSVGDVLTLKLFRITSSGGRYQTSEFEVKATLIEEKNVAKEEVTTAGVYENDNYNSFFEDYFGNYFGF